MTVGVLEQLVEAVPLLLAFGTSELRRRLTARRRHDRVMRKLRAIGSDVDELRGRVDELSERTSRLR